MFIVVFKGFGSDFSTIRFVSVFSFLGAFPCMVFLFRFVNSDNTTFVRPNGKRSKEKSCRVEPPVFISNLADKDRFLVIDSFGLSQFH